LSLCASVPLPLDAVPLCLCRSPSKPKHCLNWNKRH